MKRILATTLFLASSVVFAQATGTISNGTNSNAQQSVYVNNQIGGSGGGATDVNYHGSYTVKSAPTVYAPALTASITETCWGSASGAVSAVGFGITGAATIKDYDCNRRLNAAVAGRMGRMDIAFNIMCQSDDFREAAAITDTPCPSTIPTGKQGTEVAPKDDKKVSNITQNKDGQWQYKTAEAK